MGSEQEAHADIDRLLTAAGWRVQDAKAANILAARGDHVHRQTGIHE